MKVNKLINVCSSSAGRFVHATAERREINSKRTNEKFFSWLGVSERNFSINMLDCV